MNDLHFIWLRDCCYCDDCGDSYSSNRFFLPSDIGSGCQAESVQITPEGNLELVWREHHHHSTYSAEWLRRYRYDSESRSKRFHQPKIWNHDISSELPKIKYQQAIADALSRFELFRMLRDYGFVIVAQGPCNPGSIEQVAKLIGDLGDSAYSRIFDLTPSSLTRTLGNTTRPVPPHTDEAFRYTPPGINVLGCVRPASEGGDSILVDGFNLAGLLREEFPEAFQLLATSAQSFHRIHPGVLDQRARQRVFALDDRGEVVGVRVHTRSAGPMDIEPEKVESYYHAYQQLCRLMMSDENQVHFRLESGDTVLFDNHRVLHARQTFSDPNRLLQICNVPRESFHEQYRLLAGELGYTDEADMILSGGMTI
ncbi:MAG: TauD/TfdA family dioxygenase [Gammaproteobacteria bacterium]